MDQTEKSLVSVILLGWERIDFLSRAIESIFVQTYSEWELILIDQKSISYRLAPMLSHHGKKIRIFFGEFDTPAAAAQYGADHAEGEYLTFLDDDNWKHEAFIEKMLGFCRITKSPVAVCNSRVVTEDGIEDPGVLCRTPKPLMINFGLLQTDNYVDWGEILISRDFLIKVGGMRIELMGYQDWDLMLRCARALVFKGGIPVLPESLHYYRQHNNQLTWRPDKQILWKQLRKELKEEYDLRIAG